jgi:hypothetical protein
VAHKWFEKKVSWTFLSMRPLAKPLVSKMLGFGGISWTFRELAGICREFVGNCCVAHKWFEERVHFLLFIYGFVKRGRLLRTFLPLFRTLFIFSPSWTMIQVEHFHRENVRMTSLYFFFQNLFSKPLVSKIVTTHESFVSKTHKIELLFIFIWKIQNINKTTL